MFPPIQQARRSPRMLVDFSSSVLSLTQKDLTSQMLAPLMDALASSAVIVSLDLSDNPALGDSGMRLVSKLISANPNIRSLRLANTGLTRWGLEVLCQGYATHKAVLTLDLSRNVEVDDMAALELQRWLSVPGASIQKLNLLSTSISPAGAVSVAKGAQCCRSLTSLALPYHLGRQVHSEVDAAMAARKAKGRPQPVPPLVQPSAWPSSPRGLQTIEEAAAMGTPRRGIHELSGVRDWGNLNNRGALACLSVLESRTSLAAAKREEEMAMASSASHTPRSRRAVLGSYLI